MRGSFFITKDELSLYLPGSYKPRLAALSLLIAVVSSCMALQIASLAYKAGSTWLRQAVLLSGSITMGGGVWVMHFKVMQAFSVSSTVSYAFLPTILSITTAIFASWFALRILSKDHTTAQRLLSGARVRCAIGIMHCSGMSAMRMALLLCYGRQPLRNLKRIHKARVPSFTATASEAANHSRPSIWNVGLEPVLWRFVPACWLRSSARHCRSNSLKVKYHYSYLE